MANSPIHPADCPCPECRHPGPDLAPSLRATVIAVAALACWAGAIWIASAAANFVASLFTCLN